MNKKCLQYLLTAFFFVSETFASPHIINKEKLPYIPELISRDEIFKEYSAIVDENYQFLSSGKDTLMIFFKCNVPKDTNLLALSARCNIPYETISTINHIQNSASDIKNKEIILPTVPGLFISVSSEDSLNTILRNGRIENLQTENVCYNIGNETFYFLKNQRFTPTERAYFLDASLGLPLDASQTYISSSFGLRKNPFSGQWKQHKGVDFAASEGTPVRAVKSGIVSLAKKNDSVFGNYIIIKHSDNSMTSVYAHLSKMCIENGDMIKKGDVIGYVGQTGMATGPHLHFEIRFGGVAEDPERLLPVKSKNDGN
ncbi:MAG: M23 family metallopeptidase [Treponema sp.]|nr:M23 family metallopeptidase [Treponema sp.]